MAIFNGQPYNPLIYGSEQQEQEREFSRITGGSPQTL